MHCPNCRSTWRVRTITMGVLLGLGLPLKPLVEATQDWSRRGLGCSDNACLAAALASRFDYTNTYFHRFPRLDLRDIPEELLGAVEFVSCSDVLEHIPPPVQPALIGLADILKPGGFAVISVPVADAGDTREYYPRMRTWDVVDGSVVWTDEDGIGHTDNSPEFHGGPGQTLAFRAWGELSMLSSLEASGFALIPLPDCPELGVPQINSSGVFLARLSVQRPLTNREP